MAGEISSIFAFYDLHDSSRFLFSKTPKNNWRWRFFLIFSFFFLTTDDSSSIRHTIFGIRFRFFDSYNLFFCLSTNAPAPRKTNKTNHKIFWFATAWGDTAPGRLGHLQRQLNIPLSFMAWLFGFSFFLAPFISFPFVPIGFLRLFAGCFTSSSSSIGKQAGRERGREKEKGRVGRIRRRRGDE